jgi:Tfp pilus assembly protein PilV
MNVHNIRNQRGFSLTEALVSFAITASGLLAIASFQAGLLSGSAYSKARTEALSLAQQKIEHFRHYTHASDDNFIDDNGDGVMDADGTYTDASIDGQNARFSRSWSLSTSGETKKIDVTVSWLDRANEAQSVMLATQLTWISPRAGVDQLTELSAPLVPSPSGRARIGDGNLADYPAEDVSPVGSPGPNGLSLYQHNEDLLLVDADDKILLTLLDACKASGTCTDFVRIEGTVYVDTANTSQELSEIHIIAADAAHCERWVPSGTLTSPPTTAGGDYRYYNYTCYLGGGWHGNIGFVTEGGLQQRDKVCQGDPTAVDSWAQPVIALRRAYRGMISKQQGDGTLYYTQGIKDAITLTGHDFVFTELSVTQTEGTDCVGPDDPMTREDSSSGLLFKDVPTDFVCLNSDANGDSAPDYLDSYDTSLYDADVFCPFDPTDPPVQNHVISGTVAIEAAGALDLAAFDVVTSDGLGNCEWTSSFAATMDGYVAAYACNVYDWGSGWTGLVQLRPNSNYIYCPTRTAAYSAVTSDLSRNFACYGAPTVTIEGAILKASGTSVSSIAITDSDTGYAGSCEIMNQTSYSCQAPYADSDWNGTLTVTGSGYVCGATAGVYTFLNYTAGDSPYKNNIVMAKNASSCP